MPDEHARPAWLDAVVHELVAVLQIDNPCQCVRLVQGVSMDAHPRGRGQFCQHAVVVQMHAIVSRVSALSRLPECTLVLVAPAVALSILGAGHHQDVAVIADASALQMGVAEAVDEAVGIVVPSATVPSFQSGVRTQLDHAKRGGGPGIGVAMSPGADPRIDFAVKGFRAASAPNKTGGDDHQGPA